LAICIFHNFALLLDDLAFNSRAMGQKAPVSGNLLLALRVVTSGDKFQLYLHVRPEEK
jgi:hypothetical protein